jgi:hypothetical protein
VSIFGDINALFGKVEHKHLKLAKVLSPTVLPTSCPTHDITPSIVALSNAAPLICRYVNYDKATSRVGVTGKMKADSRSARQPITARPHCICRQPATNSTSLLFKSFFLKIRCQLLRSISEWVWSIGEMILAGKLKHSES